MPRVLNIIRLPLAILVAGILGIIVLTDPVLQTFQFPDGSGSIALPKSLEGWDMQPGTGSVLLQGGTTRFPLMKLTVEKTGVAYNRDDLQVLQGYVRQLHSEQSRVWGGGYHARLNGEVMLFFHRHVPTAYAKYEDDFLVFDDIEWAMHDRYLPHQGEWLRIRWQYPKFAETYMMMDQQVLVQNLHLQP